MVEAYDQEGSRQAASLLADPFTADLGEAADLAVALLLVSVAPDYRRLAGWRVRAWADDTGEAWADVDEWLAVACHRRDRT